MGYSGEGGCAVEVACGEGGVCEVLAEYVYDGVCGEECCVLAASEVIVV